MTVTEALSIIRKNLSESFDHTGAERAAMVLDGIRAIDETINALNRAAEAQTDKGSEEA